MIGQTYAFIFVSLAIGLFSTTLSAQELSTDDLFDVLYENEVAIVAYAATLEEDLTDREVIEKWLSEQPVTYAGPIRDMIRERRNRDESGEIVEPEEKKKRRLIFNPDGNGILDKIVNREPRFKNFLKWLVIALIVGTVCFCIVTGKLRK